MVFDTFLPPPRYGKVTLDEAHTAYAPYADGADGDRPSVEPGLPRALALLLLVSMTAMAMMVVLVSPPAQAATYTVTNTWT